MRPGTYQASCNAGELAPELHGNTSLKQFYSGLAAAVNIQPVPQGGFDLLPRTRFGADLGTPGGPSKAFAFTVSREAAYVVVLEAGQARIFLDGVLVGSLVMPYAAADVPLVKATQRRETMILWHENYPPRRILRVTPAPTWSSDIIAWENVPEVDYGGVYTNIDEQWVVRLQWTSGATVAGTGFTLSVDGDSTLMVTIDASWAVTAAAMASALDALAGLDNGTVVTVGSAGSLYQEFTVTFSGGRNSGNNFTLSGEFINETNFALTTARTRKGSIGGEAVMSGTRGFPRCGAWYQDRLLAGGFQSKSSAFLASRTAEYFDLNTKLNSDLGAMLVNLDADGGEEIVHLLQGTYLGIFTSVGEYHISDRALKRNTPPNIVRSSTNGSSRRCPPVLQEGSILYVSREENVIYAATYDAVSTAFTSEPLSILSSHLIQGICGADLQVSQSTTNAQRYLLPRDDGLLIVACLIRNQEVQPFVRWVTDGQVRAVCVDGANRVNLLIDRRVGTETRRFLEIMADDLLFDGALTKTLAPASTVVSGLEIHEGAEVWADVDGYIEGPFTVTGGAITLPNAGSVVTVGRWTPPFVKTLPLARDIGGRSVLKRPARVHTVQLDVLDTTSIALGANGSPAKDIPLARAGDRTDQPQAPVSRELVVTGLRGFSSDGQVTITQVRPGRLQVRDITIQARL